MEDTEKGQEKATIPAIIVTGGSSGLGKEIIKAIRASENTFGRRHLMIQNWSIENGVDVRNAESIKGAIEKFSDQAEQFEMRSGYTAKVVIDTLINCAGVNHIEFIPKLSEDNWDLLMDTNAKGIFLTAKYLVDLMPGGTILNIISNASHMPMTSSIAYNASKGAAAIMTKQMSRELIKTHGITVFGISPNKLADTGMSRYIDERVCELRGWTKEQAKAYQLSSLPAGVETPTERLAEFIAFLLSEKERHRYLAGCDIPYGL